MTYKQIEATREQRAPVELYEFWYGDLETQQFNYTYSETGNITHLGKTYENVAIKRAPGRQEQGMALRRDAIKANGKMESGQINIRIPVTTPLSNLFLPFPPPGVVKVRVWAGHRTDPNNQFVAVWFGRVLSASREQNEAVLTCDNSIISHKRLGNRRPYTIQCPWVLYDPLTCKADRAAATREFVVQSVAGGGLALPANWFDPYPVDYYFHGRVRWTSEFGVEERLIIGISGENNIMLNSSTRGLDVGDTVQVSLGCHKSTAYCQQVFQNINNYGGQPLIPFKNPSKTHPFW